MAALSPFTAETAVPGHAATWSGRRAALAELAAAGWPTRRREHWRYTDLEPLASAGFALTPDAATAEVVAAVRRRLDASAFGDPSQRLVLLDGQRVPGLGATTIAGVEISDPEARWSRFETEFAGRIAATQHPLAALNTAFARHGLWLRLPPGVVIEAPIHIVIAGSARSGIAAQPRILIDLDERAKVTIVQHFVDCDPPRSGWTNCVTQVRQAAGSQLELYRFQRHGADHVHTSLLAADLAADAELTTGLFDLGARLTRNDVSITLGGLRARTELFGLFLAGAGQHIDNHTTIHHAAGETVSVENFRGIIGERGRGVFNGKVVVERGCQRIDAQQNNDNLLLGERAEIDTKPELEIYANDVKCSHGSTVGELDAEQLFYLETRGLDTHEARRLLTTAFAAVILERIGDESVRDQATRRVTARLDRLMET
jgi:Fe-S cluster assembly protein SufD